MSRPVVVHSPAYEVDIGPHVFPTAKYRLVRDRLLEGGVITEDQLVEPEPASWDDVARVHTSGYVEKVRAGEFDALDVLKLEVPFSEELREAMLLCCGGTIRVGRRGLDDGVAVHLGGGFHHAYGDHGEGFCLLNDVAVAAAALLEEGVVKKVAVVDLDVHHGNGTAAIFSDEGRVFTFSMHQERNYPFPKPPGDLDVGLADGTEDEEYLERLEQALDVVFERGRPELVFYLAGADPYREDQLGGLGLTRDGLRRRDETVFGRCREADVGVGVLLAGGYAVRQEDTVAIHCGTVEAAVAAVG